MNNNDPAPEQNNNSNRSNRTKPIVFIITIYFLLVLSSKFDNKYQPDPYQKAINLLKSGQTPTLSTLFGIFQSGKSYLGTWQKLSPLQPSTYKIFEAFQSSGQLKASFNVIGQSQLSVGLLIINGEYLDQGYLSTVFEIKQQQNNTKLMITKQGQSVIVRLNLSKNAEKEKSNPVYPTAICKIQKLFNTLDTSFMNIQSFVLNFTLNQEKNKILFDSEIKTSKFYLKFNVLQKQRIFIKTFLFALLSSLVAYFIFNSVLKILRHIIEGTESAERYSLISVLVATLWDTVLCLVCFMQAFINQQNLILFIFPSFMLCILFTNLELRWMLSIFQSNNQGQDLRSILCKFNLISYGSILLIYPILFFTNLSQWLFIGISLLFLPQIYVNAQRGIRPDLNHPYYSKFLISRFLIIFYVRGFPYNIFELKPNYLLCLVCLTLVGAQYTILWIQKTYGPKKVFPKFMLPPIFNYELHQEINIEVGDDIPQCVICLTPLHIDPDLSELEKRNSRDKGKSKLMKAPCSHRYHDKCLKQWMNIKKECPQCRMPLPPYE